MTKRRSVRMFRASARSLALRHAVESLETRRLLSTVTVTGTGDTIAADGLVTLREAVASVNSGANVNADVVGVGAYGISDTINFNIAGAGVKTINVTAVALPTIVKPLTINGYSQSGASANTSSTSDNAKILIELNGTSAGLGQDGLTLGTGSGGSTIRGLAINRFSANGIRVQSNGNTIGGNFIGTDPTGTTRLPNGNFPSSGDGILVEFASNNFVGTPALADVNVLSGNALSGVRIFGTLAQPATGNTIQNNFIGVAADGFSSVGNRTEPAPAPGSPGGNNLFGIEISGGTNNIIGGTTGGTGNVIGFNGIGIDLTNGAQGNIIQGNGIGVGVGGTLDVGNLLQGIAIRSSNGFSTPLGPAQTNEPGTSFNTIGGTVAGAGNTIKNNGTAGVAVFGNPVSASGQPNVGNAILGNSIAFNGRSTTPASPSLGIDLTNGFVFPKEDGPTPNDSQGHGGADDPNNFQNTPVITNATLGNGVTQVSGTLSAAPNTSYRIEFFGNKFDVLGLPAEGRDYNGFINAVTDSSGNASFTATLDPVASGSEIITANATDPAGNTSEFSAGVIATPVWGTYTVTGTGDTVAVDGVVTLREAIMSSNAGSPVNADVPNVINFSGRNIINFNIPGSGVQTISPTTELPAISSQPVYVDGSSQPGFAGSPLIEVEGSQIAGSPTGIGISTVDTTIRSLVINRFAGTGISINFAGSQSAKNQIVGCYIGTNAAGTAALTAPFAYGVRVSGNSGDNLIGGTSAADRNVIAGNYYNVFITDVSGSHPTVVSGNFIGTDVTGQVRLGATVYSVYASNADNTVVGGTAPGAGNVIAAVGTGVNLGLANNARVQGNWIGTDKTGTIDLGGDGAGVVVESNGVQIGGTTAAAGNVIAFNRIGVSTLGQQTLIRHNSIYANDEIGIDLDNNGVTPNDPGDGDSGANHLQNFPVLASAISGGGNITISGLINTNLNSPIIVDFYSNDVVSPSGNGEGKTWIGSTAVFTDNSSNNASFSATFPVAVPSGKFITATATLVAASPAEETSEFSTAIDVTVPPAPPPPPVSIPTIKVNDVTHTEGNSGTKDFTFTVTLSQASANTVTVHYVTQNGSASSGSDYQSKSGTLSFSPGQTSKTVTVKVNGDTAVETNETFFLKLSSPTNATIADGSGLGTIQNDDPTKPKISVSGSSSTEGNSGTKAFTFKITLDQATTVPVSVKYATSNGTATAGSDYNSASGTVTFAAGETVKTITVLVKGDLAKEADETFFVKLSSAINGTIAVGTGKGTIRNDD